MLDNVNISSQRLFSECLSVMILDTNTYLRIGTDEKYKILPLILIQCYVIPKIQTINYYYSNVHYLLIAY